MWAPLMILTRRVRLVESCYFDTLLLALPLAAAADAVVSEEVSS